MFLRDKHLKRIEPFIESDLIKVLTGGMRRSGKSVLLNQIKDKLVEKSIDNHQIIYINFESFKYRNLYNAESLYLYISEQLTGNEKYYLLFDKIQMVGVANTIKFLKSWLLCIYFYYWIKC